MQKQMNPTTADDILSTVFFPTTLTGATLSGKKSNLVSCKVTIFQNVNVNVR